jgi:hypothetical protein
LNSHSTPVQEFSANLTSLFSGKNLHLHHFEFLILIFSTYRGPKTKIKFDTQANIDMNNIVKTRSSPVLLRRQGKNTYTDKLRLKYIRYLQKILEFYFWLLAMQVFCHSYVNTVLLSCFLLNAVISYKYLSTIECLFEACSWKYIWVCERISTILTASKFFMGTKLNLQNQQIKFTNQKI